MIATTQEAEWARRRLVARVLEYRSTAVVAPARIGRHVLVGRGTRYANAIVDYVAIAESFSVSLLIALNNVEEKELATWKARETAWIERQDVRLDQFSDWSVLLGYVELRNAIQHGLGNLTERQLGKRKGDILRYIKAAGVQRNGIVLLPASENVERCEQVCRSFIDWLDLQPTQGAP